jgi:hypothetical protein
MPPHRGRSLVHCSESTSDWVELRRFELLTSYMPWGMLTFIVATCQSETARAAPCRTATPGTAVRPRSRPRPVQAAACTGCARAQQGDCRGPGIAGLHAGGGPGSRGPRSRKTFGHVAALAWWKRWGLRARGAVAPIAAAGLFGRVRGDCPRCVAAAGEFSWQCHRAGQDVHPSVAVQPRAGASRLVLIFSPHLTNLLGGRQLGAEQTSSSSNGGGDVLT